MFEPLKLSHSSTQMYLTCGEKYRLHYQERLRGQTIGSALFFGKSIDAAIGRMLLSKKKEQTKSEQETLEFTPEEIFDQQFTNVSYNNEMIDISKYRHARYYSSDLDLDLLTVQDIDNITEHAASKETIVNSGNLHSFVEDIKYQMKNERTMLDEHDQSVYNYICWLSLRRKGHLLIEAFLVQGLPLIHEVYSTQEMVEFKDGEDTLIGYIDFIASFTDSPSVKYVVDLKTSSKPYTEDSVRTSDQLAVYCEYKKINKASFMVIEKKLRKRAPRVRVQVVKDTMPDTQVDKTFNGISKIIENIQSNKFDKNKDSCYAYGVKCPYYGLCHFGSSKDLVSLKGVSSEQFKDAKGGEHQTKGEVEGVDVSGKKTGC